MNTEERATLRIQRDYKVVKANNIIQRARYDLSIQELKILAFLFSMIKPTDHPGTMYTFKMADFCRIGGIKQRSGTYYNQIKRALKGLADKSFWAADDKGREVLIRWIDEVIVDRSGAKITVKFHQTIEQYIHGLFQNYTEYTLLSTLPMRSAYSFRLYEILKSYAYLKKYEVDLDLLKQQLIVGQRYDNFKDFRKKILEVALKEINAYTDLIVNYDTVKEGKRVVSLVFHIAQRDIFDYAIARQKINHALDEGQQLSIFDFIPEDKHKGEM